MKFSIGLSALAFGLAIASPLEERATNYQTVVNDITVIGKDLSALNATVNAFQPGIDLVDAIKLLAQSNQLNQDIQKGTSDAKASPNFGDTGSNAVAIAVLNLQGPIDSTLNNIITAKPKFDKAILNSVSLSFLVLNQLQTLKKSTDAFAAALVPKLSSTFQSVAPVIVQDIDSHFNSAIVAYGGKAS